ncbi:restriction endonuclease subunit S [Dysgonomonas sp. 216]|uniref:restriction endonuclease subunit S n=1 Tax=Dysgonomonas sp. 216 TaxID=2302934 RepID=UPI0013D0BF38|nr:restriction endonuclease subunit S [Dysgonomonas sp. 216]
MKQDRKEKGNVPNLRFPEFEGEWEEYKLSDIAQKITTKNKNGRINNVISNSAQHGLIPQLDFFDKEIANDDNTGGYYIIENGDYVYNPRKSVTAPYGPVNIYNGDNLGIVSPLYLCFKVKNINKSFLFYFFKSSFWHRFMYLNGDSGARYDRVSIKDETFFKLPIHCPEREEQEKIAQFLSLLDQRIETQSKIIEDLKKLKTALVDVLYNFHNRKSFLRFPEFSDCWQQYTYGDLFHVSTARNIDQSINLILSASQTRGMIERDKIDIDIKFEQASTRTYKIVQSGNYIIHLRSFQGGFAFSEKEGICSPAYTVLKPTHLLKYAFMKDYFISSRFIKTLKLVTYGIRDGRSINVEEFLKLPIAIPSLEEQSKIDEILIALEDKIFNEYKLYISFIKQKQCLLKNMFI